MKRDLLFFLIFIFLCPAISEAAKMQEDLKIKDVFRIYGKRKNVVMVELSKEMLDTYDITFYKSITIKNDPEALSFIRKCLDKDQEGAHKIKEVTDDGGVISAYYQIPVKNSSFNRFILFKVNPKGVITLIYIEGELDSDDLITILFTKKDL
jgi:Serine dehydrogenase proteinase.